MKTLAHPATGYPMADTHGPRAAGYARAAAACSGFAPYSIGRTERGLPELVDARGGKWGVFASEQLARATAERLSR